MLTAENFKQSRTAPPEGLLLPEWFVAVSDDLEVLVRGDGNGPFDVNLRRANDVLENLRYLTMRAQQLLESFMKDKGTWCMHTIDCGVQATELNCDFALCFSFESTGDPWEYTYTYFRVGFVVADVVPPSDRHGRPVKFIVGFH